MTKRSHSLFASRDAEIVMLKREVEFYKNRPVVADFAKRVGEDIMLMLANTAFSQWPEMAKVAFWHETGRTPVAAEIYRRMLDKAKP